MRAWSAVITVLLASPRLVTGTLAAREARLSDALNNRLESVIRLENAHLGRYGNQSANTPVSVAVVPKQQIVVAYETGEGEAPIRAFSSFVSKERTDLLLLAAGLRITGTGHGVGRFDAGELQQVVHGDEDHFLPVTNATLALNVEGVKSVPLPFLLLNVRHLQFIART